MPRKRARLSTLSPVYGVFMRRPSSTVLALATTLAAAPLPGQRAASAPIAPSNSARGAVQSAAKSSESLRALLDRSITNMGGDSALRAISSIRLDMMTQWLRVAVENRPFMDYPSFERNIELRDYTTRSWRNTRGPISAAPTPNYFPLIVRDTIGIVQVRLAASAQPTWVPLSVAYVDERREIFAFAPERIALTLRDDPKATLLTDTLIDGAPYARVRAVVDHFPTTVFLRRSDALPVMIRFRADETNDFGLAMWGEHEVEFWYTGWGAVSNTSPVILPRQRDVRRVGRPYKRMTLLSAVFNAPVAADSFAISDSLTTAYLTGRSAKAMWDVPDNAIDSIKITNTVFATGLTPALGMTGAVQIGGRWMMLETGVGRGVAAKIAAWAQRTTPTVPLGGAFAFTQNNGGLAYMVERKLPVIAGPTVRRLLPHLLPNGPTTAITVVNAARWVRIGTDSVWVQPLTTGDLPGSMAVYSPTLKWLYFPGGTSPAARAEFNSIVTALTARKLSVEQVGGSGRGLTTPYTPTK